MEVLGSQKAQISEMMEPLNNLAGLEGSGEKDDGPILKSQIASTVNGNGGGSGMPLDGLKGDLDKSQALKLQLLQKLFKDNPEGARALLQSKLQGDDLDQYEDEPGQEEQNKTGIIQLHDTALGKVLIPWWCLFVLVTVVFLYIFITQRAIVSTSSSLEPLLQESGWSNSLGYFEYRTLRSCVLQHGFLKTQNTTRYSIDAAGYLNTKGFVARFNLEGLRELKEEPGELGCFLPFISKVKHEIANTFVLKVFSVRTANTSEFETEKAHGQELPPSIGWHRFSSANIKSRHSFIAHQATLLHIQVPSDMEGGACVVYAPSEPENRISRIPYENKLLNVRGDALLKMEAFSSKLEGDDAWYTGILLEQYSIPESLLPYSSKFALHSDYERFQVHN